MRYVTIVNPRIATASRFRSLMENPRVTVEDLYVAAPVIETRGTWKAVDIISDRSLAELASLYSVLNHGKAW